MHFHMEAASFVDVSLNLHNSNVAVNHIVMVMASTTWGVSSVLTDDWFKFIH